MVPPPPQMYTKKRRNHQTADSEKAPPTPESPEVQVNEPLLGENRKWQTWLGIVVSNMLVYLTPKIGEMIRFWRFFPKMGWFNHQLDWIFFKSWVFTVLGRPPPKIYRQM